MSGWIRSPHVPGQVDFGQVAGDPADDEVHRHEVIRKQERQIQTALLRPTPRYGSESAAEYEADSA